MSKVKSGQYKTPAAEGHFVNLFTPRSVGSDDEPKYGIVIVLRKDNPEHMTFVNEIAAKMNEMTQEAWGTKLTDRGIENALLKDGDKEGRPEWKGAYIMRLKSERKPDVRNRAKGGAPATADECYSGALYRCMFGIFTWTYGNSKKGISAGLNNVLKYEDGEPVDGRTAAEDDFADDMDPGATAGPIDVPGGNGEVRTASDLI